MQCGAPKITKLPYKWLNYRFIVDITIVFMGFRNHQTSQRLFPTNKLWIKKGTAMGRNFDTPLAMTNSSPWYRWPIEIDVLPGFTYEKWWIFP